MIFSTIQLVAHAGVASSGSSNSTNSPIDMTGAAGGTPAANFIVVMLSANLGSQGPPTDSCGNTYKLLIPVFDSSFCHNELWYCPNPTVANNMTFRVPTRSYDSFCIAGFSGVDTSCPVDVYSKAGTTTSPAYPGSITPNSIDELILTAIGTANPGVAGPAGFNVTDSVQCVAGSYQGSGIAYVIQSSPTAVNPGWTVGTTYNSGVAVFSIRAAVSGSPSVLSTTNAFPNAGFQQHSSGKVSPTSKLYPGAVQPKTSSTTVLSYQNAFPNSAFPANKFAKYSALQTYLNPGAVQPATTTSGSSGNTLFQTITALSTTSLISLLKTVGSIHLITPTSTLSFGKGVSKFVTLTSTGTTIPIKGVNKSLSLSSSSSASLLKIAAKNILLSSSSSTTALKNIAKNILLSSTSAVSLLKNIAKNIALTSSSIVSVVANAVTGAIQHVLTIVASSTTGVSIRNTVAKMMALTSTSSSNTTRSIGKIVGITPASLLTIGRGITKSLSVSGTSTTTTNKSISKIMNPITSSSLANVLKTAGKVIGTNIVSSTSLSAYKAFLVTIAAVSQTTTSFAKAISKGVSFTSPVVVSATKVISKSFAITASVLANIQYLVTNLSLKLKGFIIRPKNLVNYIITEKTSLKYKISPKTATKYIIEAKSDV